MINIEKAKREFDNHYKNYPNKNAQTDWKYNHSLRVTALMEELAPKYFASREHQQLIVLIAILHDIGRFEQYSKGYSTIAGDSTSDHAEAGIEMLFNWGLIRNYIEDNQYDDLIKVTIQNHNQLEVAPEIEGDTRFFCNVMRDVDKLDNIYKIGHLEKFPDDAEISDKVIEIFLERKTVPHEHLKSKTDGKICQLAFIFDLKYPTTFKYLKEKQWVETIEENYVSKSPNTSQKLKQCFETIKSFLNEKEAEYARQKI